MFLRGKNLPRISLEFIELNNIFLVVFNTTDTPFKTQLCAISAYPVADFSSAFAFSLRHSFPLRI